MNLHCWSTIRDVKEELKQRLEIPMGSQRLFFRGKELKNKHSLQDCGIFRNFETLLFGVIPRAAGTGSSDHLLEWCGTHVPLAHTPTRPGFAWPTDPWPTGLPLVSE